MTATVDIERSGAVATLWMDRPEVRNAFDMTLIGDLTAACERVADDPAVRVVVLAGRGPHFSAGADLNWMRAAADAPPGRNRAEAEAMATMLRRLAECPKPVVARVQGAAIGGGLGLAAACDLCVAAGDAVFAASEVRLGLIPSAISPYVLRAVGERQARRWFLTAERVDAMRAQAAGLVHEVAAPEALDAAVGRMVETLLAGGPAAQAAVKSLLRAVAGRAVDDELVRETARRIAEVRATPEAREGVGAFLDKRRPGWTQER